jgi:SAM-dependent methyltransferase
MSKTDEIVKKENYFSNRYVDPNYYGDFKIPRYLKPFLPLVKESFILDIGCGYGQFLGAMKKEGYTNLLGIDINSEALTECKKKGIDAELIEDICSFYPKQKFDFIIMNHVLEHIEKDKVIDTLKHIKLHLLNDGGSFALMVPNAQSPTGVYWRYEDFTHNLMFTAGSCLYVLKSAGFKNVNFMDADGTSQMTFWKKWIVKSFLLCYKLREDFWGFILQTTYHKPSPRIYSFELKVLSKN